MPEAHVMAIPLCATQNMLNCSNAHGLVHDLQAVVEVCGDKSLGVVLVARNPSRVSALPMPMRANAIGYQASSPAVSEPAVP